MKIDKSSHFTYWQFPLIVSVLLVLMNYSGIQLFTELVSPNVNREFGLLENLQLLLIATTFVYIIKAIRLKDFWFEKLTYTVLSLFFLVLFLEEIDYGIHYYEYFIKGVEEDKSIVRNFHNQGDNNFYLRQSSYVVMVLVFVLLPLLRRKIKNSVIHHISASSSIIYSFLVYLFIGQLSRWMPKFGMPVNESLRGNHQEFEELVLYYIILLFVYEIAISKKSFFTSERKLQRTNE
tara:strand:- start:12327 stop:13031 length:705 start_codon:yes stop_codon:yes gene_type:complete